MEERVYLTSRSETRLRKPDALVIDQSSAPLANRADPTRPAGGVAVLIPEREPLPELFLTIRDLEANEEVVTIFEILSPANKLPGSAREEYLQKRGAVLASRASLIEVDFLRAGLRMPVAEAPEAYDYSILISRAIERPAALLPFGVREPIPAFPVPLRAGNAEPMVDVSPALAQIYATNRLGNRVDYSVPPEPPLRPELEAWANQLLTEQGLR